MSTICYWWIYHVTSGKNYSSLWSKSYNCELNRFYKVRLKQKIVSLPFMSICPSTLYDTVDSKYSFFIIEDDCQMSKHDGGTANVRY